ncbi:glycerophosphoryl diester phosphodiesterase [Parapedobacter composti]|uniref:Glycerophosphoryl diester phosphodiesterase n=2 Tax=Parapedobacter composti TaxID=623281 RepID=A0A1I1F784_9SPHI|nr:glycerophosphoryl diester phosphodiesterase [Parapedobacter composti]
MMTMQLKQYWCLAVLCFGAAAGSANAQQLHTLEFKSPKELHRFFRYEKGKTIISGHRGSIEAGLPENSIAAFEKVLEHTPAFFEIDPRLTKDSVIILMHDATLDRTTNGRGKVADFTWEELKQLRLKDKDGNLTPHRIPTLAEVIEWARGKTILNLDRKDVPLEMTADLIRELDAYAFVMVTVHSPEQARFYLDKNKHQMLSAHIQTEAKLEAYQKAKIPFNRMIAYIGPDIKPGNRTMYRLLNARGTMCMISAAPTYDKLPTAAARAEAYRAIIADGASILESDLPIEVAKALALHR